MCNAPGIRKRLLRQEDGGELNQAMVGLNIVTYFEVILKRTNYNFLGCWNNLKIVKLLPQQFICPLLLNTFFCCLQLIHNFWWQNPNCWVLIIQYLGKKVGYKKCVEDGSQTCPKSRMTEASRDHIDLSQHFPEAEEPLAELSLHLTSIWSQSCTSGSFYLHTVAPVSSEGGFIWIKSSLGKKFEEPVKVFWINSIVSSPSTHWMGKNFTRLETKQCCSFKYLYIILNALLYLN